MRRLLGAGISLVALFITRSSMAGNGESFYLGSDAAMLAGAASASTEGASALWYNPARIAHGHGDSIDASVSAYALRLGGSPDLVQTPSSNVAFTRWRSLDFQAVPTALAYKRRLGRWDLAIGLFVPTSSQETLRSLVETRSTPTNVTRLAIDASDNFTEYFAGVGTGAELAKGLSLGISAFGYYSTETGTNTVGAAVDGGPFILQAGSFSETRFGFQAATGLAWNPVRPLRFGFVVHTPTFKISASAKQTVFEGSGTPTAGAGHVEFNEDPPARRSSFLTPARLETGVAFDVAEHTTVAADVKIRAPYSNDVDRVADGAVDVRAGIRSRVAENVWVGGGLFTDRTTTPKKFDPTATALDYYGLTLAVQLGRPYRAVDADNVPRRLHFSTTFAFSYAVGVGTLGNVAVAEAGGDLNANPEVDRAIAHELTLMLGSSLSNLAGP